LPRACPSDRRQRSLLLESRAPALAQWLARCTPKRSNNRIGDCPSPKIINRLVYVRAFVAKHPVLRTNCTRTRTCGQTHAQRANTKHVNTDTHTHTHALTHTRMHICTKTHTHPQTNTLFLFHTHTKNHAHTDTHARANAHAQTQLESARVCVPPPDFWSYLGLMPSTGRAATERFSAQLRPLDRTRGVWTRGECIQFELNRDDTPPYYNMDKCSYWNFFGRKGQKKSQNLHVP